jgi:hypothetical protein
MQLIYSTYSIFGLPYVITIKLVIVLPKNFQIGNSYVGPVNGPFTKSVLTLNRASLHPP